MRSRMQSLTSEDLDHMAEVLRANGWKCEPPPPPPTRKRDQR